MITDSRQGLRRIDRRLVEVGTRIAGMGYAAEGDIDDITQAAQAELFQAISERTASNPGAPIGDDARAFSTTWTTPRPASWWACPPAFSTWTR